MKQGRAISRARLRRHASRTKARVHHTRRQIRFTMSKSRAPGARSSSKRDYASYTRSSLHRSPARRKRPDCRARQQGIIPCCHNSSVTCLHHRATIRQRAEYIQLSDSAPLARSSHSAMRARQAQIGLRFGDMYRVPERLAEIPRRFLLGPHTLSLPKLSRGVTTASSGAT